MKHVCLRGNSSSRVQEEKNIFLLSPKHYPFIAMSATNHLDICKIIHIIFRSFDFPEVLALQWASHLLLIKSQNVLNVCRKLLKVLFLHFNFDFPSFQQNSPLFSGPLCIVNTGYRVLWMKVNTLHQNNWFLCTNWKI